VETPPVLVQPQPPAYTHEIELLEGPDRQVVTLHADEGPNGRAGRWRVAEPSVFGVPSATAQPPEAQQPPTPPEGTEPMLAPEQEQEMPQHPPALTPAEQPQLKPEEEMPTQEGHLEGEITLEVEGN
jgi:hypothetical protein